jgi:hypothetical protein
VGGGADGLARRVVADLRVELRIRQVERRLRGRRAKLEDVGNGDVACHYAALENRGGERRGVVELVVDRR